MFGVLISGAIVGKVGEGDVSVVLEPVSPGIGPGANLVGCVGRNGRKAGAVDGENVEEFALTSLPGTAGGALAVGVSSSACIFFSSMTTGCFFRNENGNAAASLVLLANASTMKDIAKKIRIASAR
jgi:hypothetical protein